MICQLHPTEDGLRVPNGERHHHTLRLSFFGRMRAQDDETCDARKTPGKFFHR